jgi:hypothetical protein
LSKDNLYGREIKTAKQLLNLYPVSFWERLDLGFQVSSLMWFLSKEGKKLLHLEDSKSNLKTPKIKEYELAEENFGEDVEFEKSTKPKSILDFLRTDYGESKTSTDEGS